MRISSLLLLAILIFPAVCFASPSEPLQIGSNDASQTTREYKMKLGFLFNFIKYVDWPGGKTNVTIGVLGKNPFGSSLLELNGKIANGKSLSVRTLNSVQDARNVDLLFINIVENDRLRQIIDSLKGQSILTVGEVTGFCQCNGIINFMNEGNKIRFEINPNAAERAELKISSTLLRLAHVVRE